MSSSRRNGKPASCEPCRLNKTKCDHNYPKCGRCHQRGIADRCFYHPAPLTKRREVDEDRVNDPRPAKRKRTSRLNPWEALPTPSLSQDDRLADAVAAETYRPGYLGPTSYAAILPKDDDSPEQRDRAASVGSEDSDRELCHQHPLTKPIRTQMATDILRALRHYPLIRDLVLWYADSCQAGVVPLPLEVDLVNALRPLVEKYKLTNSVPDPRLVSDVLENSTRPLRVSPSLPAREFHKICSGDHLRFETLGLLLALAGRALVFGAYSNLFADADNRALKPRLIDEMLRASTACVMLCNLISPVNDLILWMFYENYMLSLLVCGYTGPPSWMRLGEWVTQGYALGLHRESSWVGLPPWLAETRRRVFCSTYNNDKMISTFLGRPLRMSIRHTDVKMPLDLSDDDLISDPATLDSAIQSLDEQGWNTKGLYIRAAWLRLRFVASQFREEILDLASMKLDENVERQLLDISRRIHSSWETFPQHLRYRASCWDEGIQPRVCLMLVAVHQAHWYNEFMIHKLLDRQPLTSNTELLRVSTYLLSSTLTLGTVRDRSYDIHRDFLYIMMHHGIPSGSVLAIALQEQQRTGAQFPPSISRAEVIRMLSVLISHLDAAAHLDCSGARPGEANYNLCRKASKTFTRIVDAVLDPKPANSAPEATPVSGELDLELDLDLFTAPVFEGMEFPVGDDGIDWSSVAQWEL